MTQKNKIVTVRLTDDQYAFIEKWQKKVSEEIGVDVPTGAVVRRIIEGFIKEYESGNFRKGDARPQKGSTEERKKKILEFIEEYKD